MLSAPLCIIVKMATSDIMDTDTEESTTSTSSPFGERQQCSLQEVSLMLHNVFD